MQQYQLRSISLFLCVSSLVIVFQNCSGGFEKLPDAGQTILNSSTDNPPVVPPPVVTPPPVTPPNDSSKVDVFMAAGHMGRTVMSCDDGLTWINDRSDDDAARCWVTGDPKYVECDHTPYSGTGLDAGDGWFFIQNGWGYNGTVKRSRNGVTWETIRSGGWGGGLGYAKGSLFQVWGGNWNRSTDQGATFSPIASASMEHPFVLRANDKLFVRGRTGGEVRMGMSTDGGATWTYPAGFKTEWGGNFAEGNGVIVSMGVATGQNGAPNVGYSARSTDGGMTWTSQVLFNAEGQQWASNIIFNGTHFVNWSNGQLYKSADGLTWTQTPTVTGYPVWWTAPVAFNPATGTYVAMLNVWGGYYEKQKAFRSKDGITWTILEPANFKGGHPLSKIVVGKMDKNFCPTK